MAKNPEKITTNYLVIETAMAAYAVLEDTRLLIGETLPDDHPFKDAERQMSQYCDDYGAAGLRRAAWEMAELIESVWSGMTEDEKDGAICWDFEFVPQFMLYCLNFTDEDVEPVIKGAEELRALYRTSRERCKAWKGGPPSTRQRDQFIADCRDEAEKQWSYADLIDDHFEQVESAFEAREMPAAFIKALGEELDLISFGPWK